MKIGIIGAGAMGSIFSYYLKKSDIDLIIYEKNKSIVKELKNRLEVIISDKEERINVKISDNPDSLEGCRYIFIFIKNYSTDDMLKSLSKEIKNSTFISLQNGINNFQIISKYIPSEKIIYGITTIGASKPNIRSVIFGGMGDIIIGGKNKNDLNKIKDILKNSGLNTIISNNPETIVWEKGIINSAINPIGTIFKITNGEIISNKYTGKIQENLIEEGVRIAQLSGIKINKNKILEKTIDICNKTSNNLCSMLQDIKNRRLTEIESINGVIISKSREFLIPVPVNDVIYNMIKAMERGFNK
jgi:2-dehydropantoate 2-reductase